MDLDIAAFRAAFPAFADDTAYPDAMLEAKWMVVSCYIEDNDCSFPEKCRQYAYWLMLAHLLAIGDQIAAGQPGRLVQSATEGPVNVSFAEPPNRSNFTFWLQTTPYGVELSALISVNAIGDYYGGDLTLSAFRRY